MKIFNVQQLLVFTALLFFLTDCSKPRKNQEDVLITAKPTLIEEIAFDFFMDSLILNDGLITYNQEQFEKDSSFVHKIDKSLRTDFYYVHSKICELTNFGFLWEDEVVKDYHGITLREFRLLEQNYKDQEDNFKPKPIFQLRAGFIPSSWNSFIENADPSSLFINIDRHLKFENNSLVEINVVLFDEIESSQMISLFLFINKNNEIYSWDLYEQSLFEELSFCN